MALPGQQELRAAVLEFLGQQKAKQATANEVADAMARRFGLTRGDVSRKQAHSKRPDGESAWRLQLRRVKFDLARDGAVERGRRGIWILKQ
jgi:hypothetical protein